MNFLLFYRSNEVGWKFVELLAFLACKTKKVYSSILCANDELEQYKPKFYIVNYLIIWLANLASSDWSIPGPITYGTDPEGPVTFAFFRFLLHLYVV